MKKKLLFLFCCVPIFALGTPSKQLPAMVSQWWIPELIIIVSEYFAEEESQPPPVVDFSFDNDNMCEGTTITFTSDVTDGEGDLEYLWDFDDGSTSTQANPTHVFNAPNGCGTTTYSVTLTVTDENDDTDTISYDITVLEKPDINFNDPSVANQNNAFNNCGSTDPVYAIELQNQSPSNSCISQYTINWGDGSADEVVTSFPVGTSIPHVYNGIDVFDMTIIALGDNGCTSTETYTVKNYTNPSAGFVNPGSTTNLCIPMNPIEFLITNWGGNTDDCTYTVDFGDGSPLVIYTQSDLLAFDPTGTSDFPVPYAYTTSSCPSGDTVFRPFLVVTNECSSSTVNLNDISVIINPTLAFDGPDVGCLNQLIVFENNSIPGYDSDCDRGAVYFWDFGDGSPILQTPYGLPTSVTHTYTSTGTYTVTMYSDNDFCDPTTAITDQICIEEPPVPVFSLNANEGCFPLSSIATNTTSTSNMCSNVTYLWQVNYTAANCGTTSSWEFVGGTNQTSANPQFQFNSAGIYNITLTATNDCGGVTSATQNVSVKSPPTASINDISNYCGATSISPSASIEICTDNPGDVTYNWSFPGGTPASSNVADPGVINYTVAGDYTVTLVVTNNCGSVTVSDDFSILDQPVIDSQPLSSQTLCQNSIPTNLEVNASVGTGSLSYQWYVNPANSTTGGSAISGETNSTYTPPTSAIGTLYYYVVISQVTASDCNVVSNTSEVEVLAAPTFTQQPVGSSVCENGTANQLSISYTNGTGTPTYQWYSNTVNLNTGGSPISGATSSTYDPPTTPVGMIYYYCVISFTGGGCSEMISNTALVDVLAAVVIDSQPMSTQNICIGGTISNILDVTYSGGAGTVSYQWYINTSNTTTGGTAIAGATSSSYTPPLSTTSGNFYYYVIVTLDGDGCTSASSDVSEVVVVDDPVVDTQPITNQSLCQNAIPVNLEVVASGGIGTFEYQWFVSTTNTNTGGTPLTGATSASYTPPTTTVGMFYYYVVITQLPSNLDCNVVSNTSEVEVLEAPTFTVQPVGSSICENGAANQLIVDYSNGTGTPSYQWYENSINSTVGSSPISGATSSTYDPPTTPVGMTYYYCIISFTGGGGCSEIISNIALVDLTAAVVVESQPTPMQDICIGGVISNTLDVTYSGGTGAVSYQWYINTTSTNSGGTPITGATSSSYTPPASTTSGSFYYYVVVTLDGVGCTGATSDVSEVVVVNDPVVDTQPITNQSLCQNAIPVNLEVVASGGIGSFEYQWFVNTTNTNVGGTLIPSATNASFTPPTAVVGTFYYYVEVSQSPSNLDCFVVSNASEVIITSAPTFTLQPISSTICENEMATELIVIYINGTGTPTYQWYENNIDSNSGGNAIVGATSSNFNPPTNSVGTIYYYCVITFTSGGCSEIYSDTAVVTVNQTPVIADYSDEVCSSLLFEFDPSTIVGNIVPIGTTYTWNLSNISPVGSISGATDETSPQVNFSQTLTNLTTSVAVATYTVMPTSGICVGFTFDISITVNPGISVSVTINDSECYGNNNGSIDGIISGGTPITPGNSYIINWNGPGTFTSNNASISNLEPGIYSLSVEDNSSCIFNMDYVVLEPDELILTTDAVNDISCFGFDDGEILISVTGGTLPYTYLWTTSDGNGLTPSDEDQTNLSEGTYDVEIIDANNCVTTEQFQITEPTELLISESHNSLLCFGDSNGTITVNIDQSSIPDYTYTISGIDYFGNPFSITQTQLGTSFTVNNLLAGMYDTSVTDINGCEKIINAIEILQPTDIDVDVTKVDIMCYGDSSGSITLNVSGGIPAYTYLWSDLGSGPIRTNLSAGIYTVTVTDQNDCFKILDIEILGPEFHLEPEVRNISCFGEDDGYINLNIFGGVTPITVTWDDDATAGVERNNLSPGTYTVLVTDSDSPSCPISQSFIITEPSPISSSGVIVNALDCDIVESGSINLQVTGGIAPFTFLWSNGAVTEDLTDIPPGDYSVVITDVNGCEEVNSFTVYRPPPLAIELSNNVIANCETRETIQRNTLNVTGGIPPYTTVWSRGDVDVNSPMVMTTDENGVVIVDVTDSYGCTQQLAFDVAFEKIGIASFEMTSFGFEEYGSFSIDDPIFFTNTSTENPIEVEWNFGDRSETTTVYSPEHTYTNVGSYLVTLTVQYPYGCSYSVTKSIVITQGYDIILPTGFTPNQDGINDTIRPTYFGLISMEISLFNTWGQMVYYEKGLGLNGWDGRINGKDAENGNYVLAIKAKTFYGEEISLNGSITLIR
jgi:gliding motility-associated-like protein